MSDLQAHVIRQMHAVGLSDRDAHTRLIQALQMSKEINRYLVVRVQDGIAAEQETILRRVV